MRTHEIKLKCILFGQNKIHHCGKIIKAHIDELSDRNHVIEINGERFGVYNGYYEVVNSGY